MQIVHLGYFTLKLCKLNGPNNIADQSCFDGEILKITALNPVNGTPGVDDLWRNQGDYIIETGGNGNWYGNLT
jgi:hypothetical protein